MVRSRENADGSTEHADGAPGGGLSGTTAVQRARGCLEEILGRPCESVSALVRTDSGWTVTVEVREVERIPRTTDVLGSYVVTIDGQGELVGYELVRRYNRGQVLERQESRL